MAQIDGRERSDRDSRKRQENLIADCSMIGK